MSNQEHKTPIFINRVKHDLDNPVQTGKSLKELGNIPLGDVLFLELPHEDEVITNDKQVTLKPGAHLHSAPPADYGAVVVGEAVAGAQVLPQPDGWSFVVLPEYPLPAEYQPSTVRLLLKLPPQFPDAQPDMFWIQPAVQVHGTAPKGTCVESLLDGSWQRFSWHLTTSAWRPGVSELRDYLRTVKTRFERRD